MQSFFDIGQIILDSIYWILITIIGLFITFGNYDKFKQAFPKAPSKPVVKVLGVIITLCGVIVTILSATGILFL